MMLKKLTLSLAVVATLSTSSFAFGFGDVAGAALGGSSTSSEKKVDTDKVLESVLKQVNMAKKLKEDSEKIKAEMLSSLNITMGMGATANYLINYQTTALENAGSAEQSRKVFNDAIANIINAKKNPAGGIKEKEDVLGTIQGSTGSDVSKLNKILKESDKDIAKTIKNIKGSIAALVIANGMLEKLSENSEKASLKIDNAIDTFKSKGGPVAIESVKMVALLALQVKSLQSTIQNVSKNPMQAAKVLPKLKDMLSDATSLMTVLKDYKADYDYIEKESVKISKGAKGVVKSVTLAKNASRNYLKKIENIAAKRVDLKTFKAEVKKESTKSIQKASADIMSDVDM